MWYDKQKDVSVLIGQTLKSVENNDNEELIFETEMGKRYKMFHPQDCCEHVYLEDITGKLLDLIGSPIVNAEEVTSNENPDGIEPEYQDSFTWTFYHFTTQSGNDVTLRWYGQSNGYY